MQTQNSNTDNGNRSFNYLLDCNGIKTSKRVYRVNQSGPLFQVSYRPINPKTGYPWQAARELNDGWDIHRFRRGMETSPVIQGVPDREVLVQRMRDGDWTSCTCGFSSLELALEAVARHSGEPLPKM